MQAARSVYSSWSQTSTAASSGDSPHNTSELSWWCALGIAGAVTGLPGTVHMSTQLQMSDATLVSHLWCCSYQVLWSALEGYAESETAIRAALADPAALKVAAAKKPPGAQDPADPDDWLPVGHTIPQRKPVAELHVNKCPCTYLDHSACMLACSTDKVVPISQPKQQ